MRFFFLAVVLSALAVVTIFGLRGHHFKRPPFEVFNDMDRQPRVNYQSRSGFFADGVGTRPPVAGTVPIGYELPDERPSEADQPAFGFSLPDGYYNTGRMGEYYGDGMPGEIVIDAALLERGEDRYGIYCAICHGQAGDGKGVVSNYMPVPIANLHDPQFSDPANPQFRPNGEMYEVITKGRGQMGPYGHNIPVRDRWAIVAWVRALQDAKKNAAPTPAPTAPDAVESTTPAPAN